MAGSRSCGLSTVVSGEYLQSNGSFRFSHFESWASLSETGRLISPQSYSSCMQRDPGTIIVQSNFPLLWYSPMKRSSRVPGQPSCASCIISTLMQRLCTAWWEALAAGIPV